MFHGCLLRFISALTNRRCALHKDVTAAYVKYKSLDRNRYKLHKYDTMLKYLI